MDIYCGLCGEPWDIDSLHEEAEEQGITFAEMRKRFREEGCRAFSHARHNPVSNTKAAETSTILQDLLGDDVDAIASFSEDFLSW